MKPLIIDLSAVCCIKPACVQHIVFTGVLFFRFIVHSLFNPLYFFIGYNLLEKDRYRWWVRSRALCSWVLALSRAWYLLNFAHLSFRCIKENVCCAYTHHFRNMLFVFCFHSHTPRPVFSILHGDIRIIMKQKFKWEAAMITRLANSWKGSEVILFVENCENRFFCVMQKDSYYFDAEFLVIFFFLN